MEKKPGEDFTLLLRRAGLSLPQEEIARLQPLWEQYREHLKVLYSIRLEEEEAAEVFTPEPTLEQ